MSFADNLRKNYEGPKRPSKNLYIDQIVSAAKQAASEVSRNAKSVAGYFYEGYDGPEINKSNYKYFLYKSELGRRAHLIKGFWPNIEQAMYTAQEKSLVVESVRVALLKEGFNTVTVRAEDFNHPVKYGHSEFLHRELFQDFPAFKIFISLTW